MTQSSPASDDRRGADGEHIVTLTSQTLGSELQQQQFTLRPGEALSAVRGVDGAVHAGITTLAQPATTSVIVEFADDPITRPLPPPQAAAARDRMVSQRARFANDLAALGAPAAAVRRDYRRVLNGVALTVAVPIVDRLRSLPYVRAVHQDVSVEAQDDITNAVIGADRVWSLPDGTGAGIKVAIIDTGIDYTHSDLGGCFGSGCKVMGGYDLVNSDADPMDDHGHGTHVAGIVAANGEARGVAPYASLVAYKVLSAGGSGSTSNVIAAIELALDPDGEPATDDGADVINMSLGAIGNSDGPLAQAANNAVAVGAVVVASAGNSGERGDYTVLSPAIAEDAIAVGGTGRHGTGIASFSSRGPDERTFGIKPEVLAPGDDVLSTYLDGGYTRMSGTSMAAPHVAGSAALLLGLNPSWEPAMVKSALTGTAEPHPGFGVYEQGAGLIDVFASATASVVWTPGVLNFGTDDGSTPSFDQIITTTVHNVGDVEETVSCASTGFTTPGMTVTCDPAVMTIVPGASASIALTMMIDNAVTPDGPSPLYAYTGRFTLDSGSASIQAPAAVTKSPVLEVTYDEWVSFVTFHNRTDFGVSSPWTRRLLRRPVPAGTYDVLNTFAPLYDAELKAWIPRLVVREGIPVVHTTAVTVSGSEAIHRITMTLPFIPEVDEAPYEHDNSSWFSLTYDHPGGFDRNTTLVTCCWLHADWEKPFVAQNSYGVRVSCVSDAYAAEMAIFVEQPTDMLVQSERWRAHRAWPDGICASHDESFPQEEFVEYEFDYGSIYRQRDDLFAARSTCGAGDSWLFCLREPGSRHNNEYGPRDVEFATPAESPHPVLGYRMRGAEQPVPEGPPYASLATTPFAHVNASGQLELVHWPQMEAPLPAGRAPVTVVGLAPVHWNGRFENTTSRIKADAARGPWGLFEYLLNQPLVTRSVGFQGAMGDAIDLACPRFEFDPPLSVHPPIGHGVTCPAEFGIDIEAAAGAYQLTAAVESYAVAGSTGSVVTTLDFDTSLPDPDPPYLTAFQMRVDGTPSDQAAPGQEISVLTEVHDDVCLSSVALEYRPSPIHLSGAADWTPIPIQLAWANTYTGVLPGITLDAWIGIRLAAEDCSGNRLEMEASPAAALRYPDTDTDGLTDPTEQALGTDPLIADTDADGCSDGVELGGVAAFGGERDPLYAWDFYDVTGDRIIDFGDTLLVLSRFGAAVGDPEYDARLDRYAPDSEKPWRTALAVDGAGINFSDALVSLGSFGHDCG